PAPAGYARTWARWASAAQAATPRRVRPDRPARCSPTRDTCACRPACPTAIAPAIRCWPASRCPPVATLRSRAACARPGRASTTAGARPGTAAAWPRTASAYEKAADARALRRRLSPRTVGEVVLRRGASASAVVEVTAAHTPERLGLHPEAGVVTSNERSPTGDRDFRPKRAGGARSSGWHAGCNDLRAIAAGNLKFGAHGAWRRWGRGEPRRRRGGDGVRWLAKSRVPVILWRAILK